MIYLLNMVIFQFANRQITRVLFISMVSDRLLVKPPGAKQRFSNATGDAKRLKSEEFL